MDKIGFEPEPRNDPEPWVWRPYGESDAAEDATVIITRDTSLGFDAVLKQLTAWEVQTIMSGIEGVYVNQREVHRHCDKPTGQIDAWFGGIRRFVDDPNKPDKSELLIAIQIRNFEPWRVWIRCTAVHKDSWPLFESLSKCVSQFPLADW